MNIYDIKEKHKTLKKRVKRLKEKTTKAEKIVYDYLTKKDVRFFFQKGFIGGSNYVIVDFYLPKPFKICIEIDGGYHNTPKQKKRDLNRDDYLINYRGFKVYHFTNEQIFKDVSIIDPILIRDKSKDWTGQKRRIMKYRKRKTIK